MKYKVKAKDCLLTILVKTSYRENIDEKLLDNFSRVYIRGFLKAKKLGKNKYEYTGPIGVSLKERLQNPISKRDFLFILEHVVFALQKLENAKMPIEYLSTDLETVFFNENTKELQFLFIPIINPKKPNNVLELFHSIIYSAKPLQEKDTEYISRFHYFLMGIKNDFNVIESFVMKEDRSVVNTIKKHNAGQSGFMTNDYGHYHEHYNAMEKSETGGRDDDDEEKTSLLVEVDDEKTGLLIEEDEATSLLIEDEEEATSLLVDDSDYDEDATGLLIDEDVAPPAPHFASLERVLSGEKISVNKAVFRLGKEKSYVDYFVSNNNAVSRSHADIILRGTNYFIKDLNSKNHTYVNGEKIPVQVETQIHDGDRIKLANEEFVFYE